nr:FAD-dependent oxidoreductase [Clostridia bacterium]
MSNIKYSCDIAVIGAGPAGIAAAVSAARSGASVVLCERDGWVGGMSTTGMLNVWCGNCDSDIFTEITDATTVKMGRRRVYSPTALADFYRRTLLDAGVKLLLHSQLYGVDMVGDGEVGAALLSSGGHTVELSAKYYIDSTGNGDLSYLAGLRYEMGGEDGSLQPASLEFMVGGVDDSTAVYPTFGTNPELEELMQQAVADGRIPGPAGHVILINGYNPGTAHVNMTNAIVAGLDPTDPFAISEAELTARAQIDAIVEFLRGNVPGYCNCFALGIGGRIGIRESRRFIGKHILTEYEIADGITCEDSVADNVRCGLGGHAASGNGPSKSPLIAKPYSIPYDCCVPEIGGNIRFNGRCISGTHAAMSSYRLMPVCFCIGERLGRKMASLI